MKVLVTGGSGFTGGHVIPRLVAAGHDVIALARSAAAADRVHGLGAAAVRGDLDDPASLDAAFTESGADTLVNVASLGFGHAPAIIAAAENAGIGRAVFVSTTAIFTTLDASSRSVRVAAENAIRSSALDWTVIRPTMIYGGPGDRNLWRLLRLLRRTPVVPLPDGGHRLQQPVHVDDLAAAIVAAAERPAAVGRDYDVAGPEALSFRTLVEQAALATGRRPLLVPVPSAPILALLGAVESGAGRRRAPVKAEQIQRLLEDKAFDITPARRDLGYDPRPFASGILDEAAFGRNDHGALGRAGLTARTVAHLRPGQLAHRTRLRGQRAVLSRWPEPVVGHWRRPSPTAGWPAGFDPLDRLVTAGGPSPEDNAKGVFELLGERIDLGLPIDWRPEGVSQLWRYHLHYWDWAWPLTTHPDRPWARQAFADLWRSWRAGTILGRWDEWSPYVVSLRAWVLCGLYEPLVAGTDLETDFREDLARHAGFIAANLELDVGGNHLVKNLKALIGVGVFLDDDQMIVRGVDHLARQLRIQVLADGGHYELSPSYHAQVLGDLIDVQRLLAAAGRAPVPGLDDTVDAMRGWLAAVLLPDGDVPLFGDCRLVGAERLAALGVTPAPARRLTVLRASGYVVVRPDDRVHLVMDTGPPCPPDLPAHAQADALSFVLCVDGRRVVIDPGTTTYAAGPRRSWERSTAAHSTVEIDGHDQSEVWGAFRAARLARVELLRAVDDGVTIRVRARHDGYRRLPGRPRHDREWEITAGRIVVRDRVTGRGRHCVAARLHLTGSSVDRETIRITSSSVPVRHEMTANGQVTVTAVETGPLPVTLTTTIAVASPSPPPG